ncbi:very short patch repair endonuclease [Roseomonas sp. F4]
MDRLTQEERSRLMSRVRGKDTGPEMAVRRVVHRLGFRFRLHRRGLPGTPDLVFPRLRKVLLVHGCFWHSHAGCRAGRMPSTNLAFWEQKLRRNVERDAINEEALRQLGWNVLIVWECQTKLATDLEQRLGSFLRSD